MKAFFAKWWGKFKTSPAYVKAGVAGLIFFSIYMIFIRSKGEYDNATTAVIQDTSIDDAIGSGGTYTPPTIVNDSMASDESEKLYQAQLALLNQENANLSKQLSQASSSPSTPSLKDYLNPIIAKTAGNWLTDLLNPQSKGTVPSSPTNTNTTSTVNTVSNSSYVYKPVSTSTQYYGDKGYTGFGSDAYGYSSGIFDSNKISVDNMFGSSTYTGFGSDSYAQSNFGW